MKVLLSLPLFAVLALAAKSQEDRALFNQFKSDFEKIYENELEEELRFQIFTDNYRKIQENNLNGKQTWTEGINQFTDRTDAEFKATLGYKHTAFISNYKKASRKNIDVSQLPKSVDWSKKGATTPIKNQGFCGSCWAFSTTQQIESYTFLNNKTLPVLSPQQIVSCTPDSLQCGGQGGCGGNVPQLGFTYANLEGITSEKEYPYTSGQSGATGECTYNPKNTPPKATISGFDILPTNDLAAVMHHLATVGPLTIGVSANQGWQNYKKGIFDGCPYNQPLAIDHAVQLVGYGTDPKEGDYWKVRNSWGAQWGEEGFIRLKRHNVPKCGYDPVDVLGCKNNFNHKVQVCGTCGVLFNCQYPINASLL